MARLQRFGLGVCALLTVVGPAMRMGACWIEPEPDGSVIIPANVTEVPGIHVYAPCGNFAGCAHTAVSIDFGGSAVSSISVTMRSKVAPP